MLVDCCFGAIQWPVGVYQIITHGISKEQVVLIIGISKTFELQKLYLKM